MADRVMVLGGYGVFGGRLARRLLRETDFEIVVAGRSDAKAQRFCRRYGGVPYPLDLQDTEALSAALGKLRPRLVIDAAGPFQLYGADPYRIARHIVEAGSHYLDLADDRRFVSAIDALDPLARKHRVCVLSGVSSIPALSSAAVDALSEGLPRCDSIDTVILPGNRAPRGRSVIRAVLSQAGQPMRVWRGGRWRAARVWDKPQTVRLRGDGVPALSPRWASTFDAPDYDWFPARYGACSVRFRAGLELKMLHGSLWLASGLVRSGVLRSLEGLSGAAEILARAVQSFGTDRGGMQVVVEGRDGAGRALRRTWTLIAEQGQGPEIPTIPAFVLTQRVLAGAIATGARPCLGEFTLDEAQQAMQSLAVHLQRDEQQLPR